MRKRLLIYLIVVSVFISTVNAVFPDEFYGYVFFGNTLAPDGVLITAHINGSDNVSANTTLGECIVYNPHMYFIPVYGAFGDNVSFKVCDVWVNEPPRALIPGTYQELNLTAPATACDKCKCSNCPECNSKINSGNCTVVMLNQSIINNPGTCIIPNLNNVGFDCMNNVIDGSGTGYGVYLNGRSNNRISRCTITGFESGIYLNSSNSTKIQNNIIKNNTGKGIYVYNSKSNNILDNVIRFNYDGIYLNLSSSGINNNEILNNTRYGIFYNSSNSTIGYNTVCDNNQSDFFVGSMSGNSGNHNTCDKNDGWNDTGHNGCTYICWGFCGDNVTEQSRGEECDDGNSIDSDACLSTCVNAGCGDGVLWVGVEECDDGNGVNNDGCTNVCKSPKCGDGIVQAGEECDDNNSVNNDSCTNACKSPKCGDGIVQAEEDCDDHNTVNGDGCSASCKSESGCITPADDDIYIYSSRSLCRGTYGIDDSNNNGVIIINSGNLVFDCNGSTLIGSGYGRGVFNPGFNNVTIKNCVIINYGYGIYVANSNFNSLTGNRLNSNAYSGIKIENSGHSIVSGNNASANTLRGIWLYNSSNSDVFDNNASLNNYGIWLSKSDDNRVKNNRANLNNYHGIYLFDSSDRNNITNNTAEFNNNYGIFIYYFSTFNILRNNTLRNNNLYGVTFDYGADNNVLIKNTICNNSMDVGDYVTGKNSGDNNTCENVNKWSDYGDTGCSLLCNCDKDGDGFNATVCDGTDCNDNNASIHPGAVELCNGIDDNCNLQVDEGLPLNVYFRDFDLDFYGNSTNNLSTCNATPPSGYVNVSGDCNDNNNLIHPGAAEVCNGMDDNCDGQTDENACVEPQCDLNNDGIIVHDWNDLMLAYQCFLGVEKNCNVTGFRDWSLMKREYLCFVNIRAY